MAGIKDDIKNLDFKNAYLLWGEEAYLRDHYKSMIVKKVIDPDFVDFNYLEYTTKQPDNDEIADYITSYPFMGDKKIVYIKDSGLTKKINESDKKFWTGLLSGLPDFVIIIFSEKEVDKRNAIYKAITKDFCAEEFPLQKETELITWIGRHLNEYKKEISRDAASYLIECCSPSMYLLKNEIEKLAFFNPSSAKITEKDIDICCCKVAENRVFKMIDEALEGNVKGACEKYDELKLLREEPIAINGAIFSKYNQLRKVKILSDTMTARDIAAKTGMRDFVVNIHLRQVKNKSLAELDKVINMCAETDHNIKNGKNEPWAALDMLMASLFNQN